jgi:hypothetical protein
LVASAEELEELVCSVLSVPDRGIADDLAGHGEEPPGTVELALVPVRSLRDFRLTDDVKAVSRRRVFCVGVKPLDPAASLVFGNVVYIRSTVRVIRMEDKAYAVEEVVMLESLDCLLEGGPGPRRRAVRPPVGSLLEDLRELSVSMLFLPQDPRRRHPQFFGYLVH